MKQRVALCLAELLFLLLHMINEAPAAAADGGGGGDGSFSSQLLGTGIRFPSPSYYQYKDENLRRLLNVGANWRNRSSTLSYSHLPPLDGTTPDETYFMEKYGMTFVLFDFRLVNLISVDAFNGNFRAEIQLILHWFEYISNTTKEYNNADNCKFVCDTTTSIGRSSCCDGFWVPPLTLPGCSINAVESITPTPYIHWAPFNVSYQDCFLLEHQYNCSWRRFWYVNIDATCRQEMSFKYFPFDVNVQELKMDIINPYASRTWFQLHKGFLAKNVDIAINGINLFPDREMVYGWHVKDVVASISCASIQSWQQTFLTQDFLLHNNISNSYQSEQKSIIEALTLRRLQCVKIMDLNTSNDQQQEEAAMVDPASLQHYETTKENYNKRVNDTIEAYRKCVQTEGKPFYVRQDINQYFDMSPQNVERYFSLLNISDTQNGTNVSILCTIAAVANLTTQGIHITIQVYRYRLYYIIKLVVPTVLCAFFAFTAFGIPPHEKNHRLTIVVSAAIALTTLQGFVVATDIPAVRYLTPLTWMIIFSYLIQSLIVCEAIFIAWLYKKRSKIPNGKENMESRSLMIKFPIRLTWRPFILHNRLTNSFNHRQYTRINDGVGTLEMGTTCQSSMGTNVESMENDSSNGIEAPSTSEDRNDNQNSALDMRSKKMKLIKTVDHALMILFITFYIFAIIGCFAIPFLDSKKTTTIGISMWD